MNEWLKQKPVFSPLIVVGENHEGILRDLALLTLCEEDIPCRECSACKQVTKGFHPDWTHLTAPFKVEDVRQALYQLRLHPYSAKKKILSLNGFENANAHVQNAFLKVLEEPLEDRVLLLGATSLSPLLPTIRSRCLVARLSDITHEIELSADEKDFFDAVRDGNQTVVHQNSESLFKEKAKAKETLLLCLKEASRQSYPGLWRSLAPEAEVAIHYLQRNLNPRLVWDNIWNKALLHESR